MWELGRHQDAVTNIRHKALVSLENGHSRAENPLHSPSSTIRKKKKITRILSTKRLLHSQ